MGPIARTRGLMIMRIHSSISKSARRAGAVALLATCASLAACGESDRTSALDESLKADLAAAGAGSAGGDAALELAPTSSRSLTVVSAIEGGPKAAPKRATPARAPQSAPAQVKRQTQPSRAAAPAPAQVQARVEPEPAPAEADAPAISAPRPAPSAAQQQDRRVYKTEAEIFRQFPFIRP